MSVTPIAASKSPESRDLRIEAFSLLIRADHLESFLLADFHKTRAAELRAEADRLDGVNR